MTKGQKKTHLLEKHQKTLWAHFANIFLGFWLLFGHFAFGYSCFALAMSDMICGVILIVFGLLSLSYRLVFAPWVIVFTGIWLNFAPLFYWAPESVSYLNDTAVGTLAIAFALLIPGLPGVIEDKGKSIPAGWRHNPSAWIQRIPVVALACVGWFISRYLAAYQLGHIDTMWDPVFGNGTKDVITSSVARFFPVSDAGLGAFAYTLEALLGLKGGENRWRTMPWLVVGFVFLVVPLGVVSVILVCLQPIMVGKWCFLCLLAAGAMLIMVTLTVDEMVAVFQFLRQGKKEGMSLWHLFWRGGEVKGIKEDKKTPSFHTNPFALIKTWHYGVSMHITLILSALLGGWLMFTPWVFSLVNFAADSDHLVGALTVVISVISLAEVMRALRFLLIPLGLWMTISTWFFPDLSLSVNLNHCIVGALIVLLSLPKGKIRYRYGKWDKMIK